MSVCVCVFVCACIYEQKCTYKWVIKTYLNIYVFTNLISTSIHITRKKKRKKTRQGQEIKVSRITARREKKKLSVKKKEKANLVRPLEKKSRDTQSVGQKKTKTFRESCNATITRVLNTSGANYKINLNRESEIFY